MHPCGAHAIIGKKGSGKSFLATKLSLAVVAQSDRILVTNLPLRLGECKAYMAEHWPAFSDDLHDRIEIIEDVKLLKRFWLYRGNGWTIPDIPKEDWNKGGRLDYRQAYRYLPTTEDVSRRVAITELTKQEINELLRQGQIEAKAIADLRPVQYTIDEIQNIFPARAFSQTSHGCLFWLSQQRKLRDDFIWMSQNTDLVDKEFRDLTDDWLYITNWGRKRKSFFRLPKVMTWAKYDQRPGPGINPMVQGSFRLDIAGIGQCYDTSAGVGIEGGLTADTKEGIGGIHWSWVLLIVAVLLYGVFQTPKLLTHGIQHLFKKRPTPTLTTATATTPATTSNLPPPSVQPRSVPTPPAPIGNVKDSGATPALTGITLWRGTLTAWLDDGTAVKATNRRRFEAILRDGTQIIGARIDGHDLYLGAKRAAPPPLATVH